MDKNQEKKILLMKIFVYGLGVLIFMIWIFNLQYVWQDRKSDSMKNKDDFSKLRSDFTESLNIMQQKFDEVKNEENQNNSKKGEALLNDVLQGAKKISTSTPHLNDASNNNCPEYINCMPTIGDARPCQVPAGCEGKTIIAY